MPLPYVSQAPPELKVLAQFWSPARTSALRGALCLAALQSKSKRQALELWTLRGQKTKSLKEIMTATSMFYFHSLPAERSPSLMAGHLLALPQATLQA